MAADKYKYLIWDWNGTLLDDVQFAISAINKMLQKRKLKRLDAESYRKIFTFPVREYYQLLGFNFAAEPYEQLAVEYLAEYYTYYNYFTLHKDAESILKHYSDNGKKQFLLSASLEKDLLALVEKLGMTNYFNLIIGQDNHYADGKIARAKKILADCSINMQETILIGDTLHDFEAANALGCSCLLVSCGHQCHERLKVSGAKIVSSLSEVRNYIR